MPSATTKTISKTGVIDSNGSSSSCFIKDGRKISVGDCALFKAVEDSPPFIGIVHCWTSESETNLKIRVNWLYRPAEVKLAKGVALEAAPNEVFYSSHSDEIPAASLLHPCKVAFLPKGVELPPGISSFVCRRVYDITNKCLWWLTDQDHIDDPNEVDQLLHRTHLEMHALEQQQCPRSPKPANGSASSPLKHSPDSLHNSSSNLSSHGKGKKGERGDQSFDSCKRERSSKPDDEDCDHLKSENMLNLEIAKFSEKGGLVDSEAVARLVQLLQPEKSEKKIDLTARCMLAGVIAATEKFDCLNQFVQLGGLFVLNEWLQEVHKGKIGDSRNLKSSDKTVDDFLLVLLSALDKLPVNLNALQMCNIGRSVNHLRSHKSSEIQKKARSLVDTWKKRVEEEMLNDEGRPHPENSHGGGRNPSGSEAVVRNPITHQSYKCLCRRVYDVTNKCLWWLTDQDHIDDPNEVDQLLHRTHLEMHALEQQQCPRSPKPANGSASSPLKHSPDSLHNSSSNLSSHGKGKKGERGDQSFDSCKRERSSKPDDEDCDHLKSENMLNLEIAKFSEKGGLVDSEAVARLVQLLQPEKSEKKIDLTARCMLAGVIAATEKFDCLNQFVQLGGLFVLNEWLQEVHKGKIGDSRNLKSSDKTVDDFLLVLLSALDKLPVNLNALQMCNIGRSVNHLRSHKSSEIQKKARSLVDTWKKRVEEEMLNDEGRPHPENSHGGGRNPSGSEAVVRNPITHQSYKCLCRRVYDITNKCLWWLTDQDHIDDPNEVDQLLHRTHLEMHALEQQQCPRSPKPANGSASSPLKHSPDSLHNSSSNLSSHGKGKKGERGDQSFDSCKRERSSKPDDEDCDHLKSENMLNLEIAKFSEKGGLVDSEAVARLVQLLQPEKSEKKIDLTARCMLAGVIAATEKFDCLNQFVQLGGLFVLNEWLQEVHKGKIGDSRNLKSSDKTVDDFLLVLLSALDKLPVNLNALQMCNIGRSVNHLRSHKSSEIQKKARSLVDTWKKRVEEEMLNDEGRPHPENSHGGGRNPSGSEAVVRNPITHQSYKCLCRRVYDVTNKCLWWLTDQDHIDDPNEVDQLLHRTHLEMHALEQQQCPRSPKPANGSASSPLKHSPDSLHNSSSNLSSHGKGKKGERGDQSFDSCKRERSSKPDDEDCDHLKSENMLNLEIAKFSEKGGLVDSEAVARLVQLLQPEKSEKKINLTARCMLAGVIAATEKFDCLNQFVQLGGLFVLNEWLQEVHKGKIGDSRNLKSSDKTVDDFLLVLLSALDKLPVNLNALQMCNIGRSVNHLRSHKSSEIQKKARSLVDTWKKRVEEEMLNDEGRPHPENSHGGGRNPSGSEAVVRNPITHQSYKCLCRRVYDITNKCLWWLTDQDHIDDPNEVDQLLHRTHLEMHALEQQQCPRSPKPANGSASSPLKHSPDSLHNSSSNLSSHGKGKKRERGDQSFDSCKRERSSKPDDEDCDHLKSENMLNLEIAKFSEKGGLVDSEAVARLVQLLQPEKSEKKIDLTARCMLAGVIAATEKFDCLNQFVQLGGLFVLNEWLQEVHKGKIGDSRNLKSSDKTVDDFLLVLLSALDKLPVNLNALQMCNIGRSVNHLRSHKSSEIQKKARSLVDTWKKRVREEMLNDEGRPHPDNSHGGSRNPSGSEAVVRNPITHQSYMKSTSVKHFPADSNSKSKTAHPGGGRSTLSPTSTTDSCMDGQYPINANAGSSEPEIMAKDGKNSSSSQSHSHSQCTGDQAKVMVPCGKEDNKRSNAESRSLNKIVGSNKHRKSAYGSSSGAHRDSGLIKSSSMSKISAVDKVSHSPVDAFIQESNNHKLIVKIPSHCQGPTESVDGSLEDSSCRNSRASSPALSEKHDQTDAIVRDNEHDYQQVPEVVGSFTCVEQKSVETKRFHNVSKIVCSPSRDEIKSRKAHDSSSSSMNSSIESFPKISEANASMSAMDDGQMNLLASVATDEISMSGSVSPSVSPHRSSKMANNSIINRKSTEVADIDNHMNACAPRVNEEISKLCAVKSENIEQSMDGCLKNNGTLVEGFATASTPVSVTSSTEKCLGDVGAKTIKTELKSKEKKQNEHPVASQKVGGFLEAQDKVKATSVNDEFEKNTHRDTAVCPVSNDDDDEKMKVNRVTQSDVALKQSSLVALQFDSMNTSDDPVKASAGTSCQFAAKLSIEDKSKKTVAIGCDSTTRASNTIIDNSSSVPDKQIQSEGCSADVDQNRSCKDQYLENKESGTSVLQASCDALLKEELHSTDEGGKSTAVEEVFKEKSGPLTENGTLSHASSGPDVDSKLGFDLNEGFSVDEGKNGEVVTLATGEVSPLEIPVSSASWILPASVIVAAAAKGSFVPPDELLRHKRELGWKGSAATSAFRLAEPRKAVEVPTCPSKADVSESSARFPLYIDLNVADDCSDQEFVRNSPDCELMTIASCCSTGGLGLGLDLNKVDEAPEMAPVGRHMASNIMRVEVSTQHVNPSISNDGAATSKLHFDLNDGPATEDFPVENLPSSQLLQGQVPVQLPLGMRINSSGTLNCLSWYPPGTSYSSVTPSALPDREAFSIVGIGGGGQCVIGGPTPALLFNPDSYRGPGLPSSPVLPFHSAPFQYPVVPYGTRFPLPTSALAGGSGNMDLTAASRVPALSSQLVGNAAAVPFQYPHAFVVSRPVPGLGSNGVIENSHNWGNQGLDINSGPGVLDIEGRSVPLPTLSGQVSTIGPQSLAEEQARMYSMAGGHVKRKEAEGGWNVDKLNFNCGDRIT